MARFPEEKMQCLNLSPLYVLYKRKLQLLQSSFVIQAFSNMYSYNYKRLRSFLTFYVFVCAHTAKKFGSEVPVILTVAWLILSLLFRNKRVLEEFFSTSARLR